VPALKLLSPGYVTTIECPPVINAFVVNTACPADNVLVPIKPSESLKLTDPLGVPPDPLTTAVRVIGCR
jgi:hypothetical protein